MRIDNLRTETRAGRRRVTAELRWEDCDRPDRELYFEAAGAFAEELEPSTDAFLVATLPLALWHGEQRILVEGPVSARLHDGLAAAMAIFALWHERCRPLSIEPAAGFAARLPQPAGHTAAFMSGGVDALALLRANRLSYPLEHPASIRSCLLLFGLNTYDHDATGPRPERLAAFEAYRQRLDELAERACFTLVPIYTNTRALWEDFPSWMGVGGGAGILCAALTLPRRIRSAWLGSAGTGMHQPPRGSHPMLDHHFSTEAVELHHGQPAMSRLEKLRLVADWEDALPYLRSCLYQDIPGERRSNCGRCEKCVRTMLGLLALGKLRQLEVFGADEVTPEMLAAVEIRTTGGLAYYSELIGPLERGGRHELAQRLRRKLAAYHWRQVWGRLGRLTPR
jgi:hypothetical protein